MGGGLLQFYLRLPCRIVDEHQILSLHDDIVSVTLPRQKSRRWCFIQVVDLSTVEKLKSLKIDGTKLKISAK